MFPPPLWGTCWISDYWILQHVSAIEVVREDFLVWPCNPEFFGLGIFLSPLPMFFRLRLDL